MQFTPGLTKSVNLYMLCLKVLWPQIDLPSLNQSLCSHRHLCFILTCLYSRLNNPPKQNVQIRPSLATLILTLMRKHMTLARQSQLVKTYTIGMLSCLSNAFRTQSLSKTLLLLEVISLPYCVALSFNDIHHPLTIRNRKASIKMPVQTTGYLRFLNVLRFLSTLCLTFSQAKTIFQIIYQGIIPQLNISKQLYGTGLATGLLILPINFFLPINAWRQSLGYSVMITVM